MQPSQDYYSILGVERDASATDIRRAFRALAKSLHPDSKHSESGPQAAYDFSTISEAYETLKDDAKRAAYDEDLQNSRQLASQEAGGRRRPFAFAAGLGIGLAIAVGALLVKGYTDRNDRRAELQKTQDSLNPRKKSASLTEPSRLPEADQQQPVESQPAASTPEPDSDAKPEEEEEGVTVRAPSKPSLAEEERSSTDAQAATTTSVERTPPPPAQAETQQPGRASSSQTVAVAAPLSEEVLALEHLIDEGADRNAAYRLTSLVGSSIKVEDLSRAAAVATKPETIELINKRISLLMKSPNGRPTTSGDVASANSAPATATAAAKPSPNGGQIDAGFAPAQDGSIQIIVGPRRDEKALRIKAGNGLAETFADCPFCPEMVVAPPGQFTMGSKPEEDGHRVEEGPAHRVFIQRPFAISKHSITNENWRACILGGGCRAAQFSSFLANPDIPASRLSWFDAKGYVDWVSRQTGKTYRLLSEAEWEYAARAGGKRSGAPSAEKPDNGRFEPVNFVDLLPFRNRIRPGSGPVPNAWGLYNMRGNSMEWVEDCWHPTYGHAPADASPWLSAGGGDCSHRMVRGGFIGADWARQRLTTRAREFADMRAPGLGFRVARDVLPATAKSASEKE